MKVQIATFHNMKHLAITYEFNGIKMAGNFTTSGYINGVKTAFSHLTNSLSEQYHYSQKELDNYQSKINKGKAYSKFCFKKMEHVDMKAFKDLNSADFFRFKQSFGVNDVSDFLNNTGNTIAAAKINYVLHNYNVIGTSMDSHNNMFIDIDTAFFIKKAMREEALNND